MRKWLLQKPLVSDSKQTFSNQYRSSRARAAMDNIETFHNKKIVVAENGGSRFEADFFKSVQIPADLFAVTDSIETFRHKKWLLQKPSVSDLK